MNRENLLSIENLSKSFGTLLALDSVSLKVNKGEVYALIGPNGSGKTTLINNIVGLLKPDTGCVTIAGIDIDKKPLVAKALIGFVPDNPVSYPFLTGNEFLYLTGNLRNIDRTTLDREIEELRQLFPISEVLQTQMSGYSRGNLQKTAFLASLIGSPKLLDIDEPIVGLDPFSIKIFGEKLKQFSKSGGAVFLSTHTLSFAHKYADRVGVMHQGKLIEEVNTPQKLDLEKMYEKTINNEYA